MKILLIHASAGHGHKMVAEAIKETAVELYGKDSVKIVDLLDHTSKFFRLTYSKGYILLISNFAWFWVILFFLSDTKYLKIINVNFRRFINKLYCYRFLNFIIEENPDVIISTHFLVNELVSYLKTTGRIRSKLISMVTDFGVHNFWISDNVDKYAVGSEYTKKILRSKNIDDAKIEITGIPIRKQFERPIDLVEVRKKLGLKHVGFTVLILTGGIGIGPIYQIVKMLKDRLNVIVVCGNNQKLYEQLKSLNYRNLAVLGWISYVEEVMAISDIVVTKPGGSTISECLAMDLPMIFFSIIPGQESQNSKIIAKNDFAFILRRPEEIVSKIVNFTSNVEELKLIKNKIKDFKSKQSAKRVLELING